MTTREHHLLSLFYRLKLVYMLSLLCACLPGLAWGQATFSTSSDPRITHFCQTPSKITTGAGNWSDAATWSPSGVPTSSDIVRLDHSITFNTSTGVADRLCIASGGALRFVTNATTSLTLTTLQFTHASAVLEIGTPATPIACNVTATVTIRNAPLASGLSDFDPEHYGHGILGHLGTYTVSGCPRTGFLRLASELTAGATSLTLASAPTGWAASDLLLIPDTRQASSGAQIETPTVSSVVSATVNFSPALAFAHLASRDRLNAVTDLGHIANLTRNVIIQSESIAAGAVPGHIWLSNRMTVDSQYAAYINLGRTTTAVLDSTTYTSGGAVNHIGTNQIGRYAFHLHHLYGPVSPPSFGAQFRVKGNVWRWTVPGSTHRRKWALTVHDSHFGLIEDNVMYNGAGALFMTEDGSETQNTITNNLAVKSFGEGGLEGLGREATGFWLRGPNNTLTNNVAANIDGTPGCGFSQWQKNAGNVKIPTAAGADTSVAGQYTLTSIYTIPLREFAGNEVYSSLCGLTPWWIGTQSRSIQGTQDSVISNLHLWHITTRGIHHYPTHRLRYEGLRFRGDRTITPAVTVFMGGDYLNSTVDQVEPWMKNTDIQGADIGLSVSSDTRGEQRVATSTIEAKRFPLNMETLWTSAAWTQNPLPPTDDGGHLLFPRRVVLQDTTITQWTGNSAYRKIRLFYVGSGARDLIQTDELVIENDGGVATEDYQVYYTAQAGSTTVPQSTLVTGRYQLWASPDQPRTNTALYAFNGTAIAGAIAPCSTTVSQIDGFVCAGAAPAAPTGLTTLSVTLTGDDATLSHSYSGSDHDGFAIFRKVGAGSYGPELARVPKAVTPPTLYPDNNLTVGVQTCYQAAAYNAGGLGSLSAEQCVTATTGARANAVLLLP